MHPLALFLSIHHVREVPKKRSNKEKTKKKGTRRQRQHLQQQERSKDADYKKIKDEINDRKVGCRAFIPSSLTRMDRKKMGWERCIGGHIGGWPPFFPSLAAQTQPVLSSWLLASVCLSLFLYASPPPPPPALLPPFSLSVFMFQSLSLCVYRSLFLSLCVSLSLYLSPPPSPLSHIIYKHLDTNTPLV